MYSEENKVKKGKKIPHKIIKDVNWNLISKEVLVY